MSQPERKFLAISDDSDECRSAVRFAAMRAKIVGAGLVIMRIVQQSDFGHWQGVDEQMRREARDDAQRKAEMLAQDIDSLYDIQAQIVICEGSGGDAVCSVVGDDPAIKVLVLGSGSGGRPGTMVSTIGKGKPLADRPLAVTVVPGDLSDDELAEMGGMHG